MNNYCVYVIKGSNGLYKIGWSGNLDRRLQSIRSSGIVPTEVIYKIEAAHEADSILVERAIHNAFAKRHIGYEWFDLRDKDIAVIIKTDWRDVKNDRGEFNRRHCRCGDARLQDYKIRMKIYESDQDRLKPFFDPKETWADALMRALDRLEELEKKA